MTTTTGTTTVNADADVGAAVPSGPALDVPDYDEREEIPEGEEAVSVSTVRTVTVGADMIRPQAPQTEPPKRVTALTQADWRRRSG